MRDMDARIIGLGSRLRGDDAVGPMVAEQAKASGRIPDGAEAVEAWGDPLELLDFIMSCRKAVVVDAVEMGESPGTVRLFDARNIGALSAGHTSLHSIGFADVMKMAEKLGVETRVSLLAVQPAACGHTDRLSAAVEQRLDEITSLAIKEVSDEQKGPHYR